MRPPKNAWPSSVEGRSVMFFAQLLIEMLAAETFESFRVYSLGTISRLDEALSLIEDVHRDRIPQEAILPALKEIVWSLDKDPIARATAEQEIISLDESVQESKIPIPVVSANITLIKRLLTDSYKTKLEESILTLLSDDKRKIQLRQACGFYCSHLINLGYSKHHVQSIASEHFFARDMEAADATTLTTFFRKLDGQLHSYHVYAPVSDELAHHLPGLGFEVLRAITMPQVAANGLAFALGDMSYVLKYPATAYDTYSAMIDCYQTLASVRALTFLAPEGMLCHWSDSMYVMEEGGNEGSQETKLDITFERPSNKKLTAGRRRKAIRNYSNRVLELFDEPSTERLLSSINTGALARTSPNTENQLISLWSAVEVLLSEPTRQVPRILHYVHLLLPCICLRHVRRQFVAVHDELVVSYRRKFTRIIQEEAEYGRDDHHTSFAAVICLAENEPLRTKLCKMAENNPLALHRMFKLHRDYSSPKDARAAIDGHEKRVEWQIHRIYRARNGLVHSGKIPSYLESLILNLAEYYRGSIATIVNRARKVTGSDPSDIDQIVAEIGIEYRNFKRTFADSRRQSELSRSAFKRLVTIAP